MADNQRFLASLSRGGGGVGGDGELHRSLAGEEGLPCSLEGSVGLVDKEGGFQEFSPGKLKIDV